MKKISILLASVLSICNAGLNAQQDANGYTTVEASMGAGYANRVFFDFSENQLTTQPATNWDIAFYRDNRMNFGTRINDAQYIKVYQASANPSDWDNVNIANKAQWGESLYNPDNTEDLFKGALEQTTINNACSSPNFTFGWACYDLTTHRLKGKVIFVLEYSANKYIKLIIDEYYGGYTFRYAKAGADGVWGETITKNVANGSADAYFNYFSFDTNSVVENNEPGKGKWDLMFTRYWNFYNNVMMYRMSGVIQSPNITVARKEETQDTNTITKPADADYSKKITTIGHSWKPVSGLIPNIVYYIKEGDKYYRMYFTQNGGQSTGNMYFKYKDISEQMLSTSDVNAKVSFGLFPNPAPNKQVTVLFDVKKEQSNQGVIQIFDFAGRKVYETDITKNAGLFQKDLNLSNLSSGMYLVTLKIGTYTETKKLILK